MDPAGCGIYYCEGRWNGSGGVTDSFDWFDWESARARMVETQAAARGVRDPGVLTAIRAVPRHEFVNPEFLDQAYADRPLPIGFGVTISQPYIVAYMTEALELLPSDRALEVGLGSGYQAAILAHLAGHVYSVEIVPELARRTLRLLNEIGITNVDVRLGDGRQGWPEEAPFDAIIATAAPDEVPRPLLDQLAPGGRMVIPLGGDVQELKRIRRSRDGQTFETESLMGVRFVPMTRAQDGG